LFIYIKQKSPLPSAGSGLLFDIFFGYINISDPLPLEVCIAHIMHIDIHIQHIADGWLAADLKM